MERDLNAAVEDYRRRINEQSREVDRLEGVVRDLAEEAKGSKAAQVKKSLRHARADLQRAEEVQTALEREYARFRLKEAIGHDPANIDTRVFDEELMAATKGGLTRGRTPAPYSGRIGYDSFRSALLADLPLGQLIENERSERKAGVILDLLEENTSTKAMLRQWAALLQSDEYVSGVLQRAAAATARFDEALASFTRGLDNLRINYELKLRKVDELSFAFEDGRPAIVATNYWENVERHCSEDVGYLVEQFLVLDEARDELRRLREELNTELRGFMATFLPRYINYALWQSRGRRQQLGLRGLGARKVCQYVLDEVDRTDFLLPRGGGLEVPVPRIPRNIAAFRKTETYRRFKKSRMPDSPGASAEADRAD